MGATYAEVTITALDNSGRKYVGRFLVDTGATDCIVPAKELERIGVMRKGQMDYELAKGRTEQFDFGIAQIEVLERLTAGRVVFGPNDAEPILGLVALESAALRINPVTQELEMLPAVRLKRPWLVIPAKAGIQSKIPDSGNPDYKTPLCAINQSQVKKYKSVDISGVGTKFHRLIVQ